MNRTQKRLLSYARIHSSIWYSEASEITGKSSKTIDLLTEPPSRPPKMPHNQSFPRAEILKMPRHHVNLQFLPFGQSKIINSPIGKILHTIHHLGRSLYPAAYFFERHFEELSIFNPNFVTAMRQPYKKASGFTRRGLVRESSSQARIPA